MGGMVVVTSNFYRKSPGLVRQHKTLYVHSFTVSLESIFSSVLSTYVLLSPCWDSMFSLTLRSNFRKFYPRWPKQRHSLCTL